MAGRLGKVYLFVPYLYYKGSTMGTFLRIAPWVLILWSPVVVLADSSATVSPSGVLDVNGDNNANSLTVSVNGGGKIEVKDGSNYLIAQNTVNASAITSIVIDASNGDDTIDVSGVFATDFTSLTGVIFLSGNQGSDSITGSELDDSIYGGTGNDFLWGEEGNDLLDGSGGSDVLTGGPGGDDLEGGTEGDWYVIGSLGDYNGDTYTEAGGVDDIIDFSGIGEGVVGYTIDDGIEVFFGTPYGDSVEGNSLDNLFFCGDGDDEALGGDGHDTFYGEGGSDDFTGGSGTDTFADQENGETFIQ